MQPSTTIGNNETFILESATTMLRNLYPALTSEELSNALTARFAAPHPAALEKPLTRKEAASMLSVSLNTINRYMNSGLLTKVPLTARSVRIDPGSVRLLLRQ